MGWIYIYTNRINGKKYIGQTTRTVEERYDNGYGYRSQVFGRALKKYGRENFDLEKYEMNNLLLDGMERFLIEYYHTMDRDFGYNCESGGNKNKSLSKETKRKLSESHKGKKPSEETKKKMSESQKGEKNHMYGKHRPEETKQRLSETHERFHYIIHSPSDEVFETNNLWVFCKEHNIHAGNLCKYGHAKGWKLLSKEEL